MLNRHYQTNGALLVGPVVAPDDVITGETLGVIPGNRSNFVVLARRFRVRRHLDGWFVDGVRHKSQIWEHGTDSIGLTVTGLNLIRKCAAERDWLTPKQVGKDEGNYYCAWTDENLGRLAKLVGLQKRKKGKVSP